MQTNNYDILVLTGPTASGKTALAAAVAARLDGEVVSADSRQVYRSMNIGTGKDYEDYRVDGRMIPYHLIDIADAGYKYNVFEYQIDFLKVYRDLQERQKLPVVCGGSGMYLDSIVSGYRLLPVPENRELREELSGHDLAELKKILASYRRLHNTTDLGSVKRAIRAIEIEVYYAGRPADETAFPEIRPLVTAVAYSREERRRRISERLRVRLKEGMIDEAESLLASGLKEETLIYYGLEYKYLVHYLRGDMTYEEMYRSLETAIHRFAKRQMTWFRGMERRGIKIHWIEGDSPFGEKVSQIAELYKKG